MNAASRWLSRTGLDARWLLWVLLLALVDFASGRAGLLLAQPPGYASAVFPPAGIALGALLVGGARLWPGVWLGSFVLNLSISPTPWPGATMLLCAAIATGSTLQALLGSWLVRRYAGYPASLQSPRSVAALLLLGGPVACVVAASIAVSALRAAGVLATDSMLSNWVTWWAGDSMGALIFMPMMLCFFGQPATEWLGRRCVVGVPLAGGFLLAVAAFMWVQRGDHDRLEHEFASEAQAYATALENQIQSFADAAVSVASFHDGSGAVSREDFSRFTSRLLETQRGLRSVQRVTRVPASELAAFQGAVRREARAVGDSRLAGALAAFRVHTMGMAPSVVAPADHYVLDYVEPWAGRLDVLGFDYGAVPSRRTTFDRARDSGGPSIAPPLRGARNSAAVLLVAVPLYTSHRVPATVARRQQDLAGFAVVRTQAIDIVAVALPSMETRGVLLRLTDIDQPSADEVYASPGFANVVRERSLPAYSHDISVAGRSWRAQFVATPAYVQQRLGRSPYFTLLAGVLVTSLLCALLLILTGRVLAVEKLMAQTRSAADEQARQAAALHAEVEQHRNTGEELRRSEAQLRLVTDSLPALIAYVDRDQRYRFVNATYERWCGVPRNQLIGRSIEELRGARYAPLRTHIERVLAGHPVSFSTQMQDVSRNRVVEVEISYVPHEDARGQVVGFFAMALDMSERTQTQINQHLATIVESSGDAIVGLDPDGRIVSWNPGAQRIYGWSEAEMLGETLMRLAGSRGDEMFSAMSRVRGGRRVKIDEATHVRKDGRSVLVSMLLSPLTGSGDAPAGVAMVARDLSEARRAEMLLVQAIMAAPYATLLVDAQGRITLSNHQAARTFGYSRDELSGMSVDALVPMGRRGGHHMLREQFMNNPVSRGMGGREVSALHKDGTEIPVEIRLSPIETDNGMIIVVAVFDVTVRKLGERALAERSAALERANAELQRINGDLDNFVHVASHDLKAPLRAVDNLAGWIEKDMGRTLSARSRQHMEQLRARVRRMEQLLADLLHYARAGTPSGEVESLDVASLVAEVCQTLSLPAGFAVSCVGERPVVRGYREPLRLVLLKLLDNALKHHDHDKGNILVRCAVQDGWLECRVSDDGPGIPAEYRDAIFGMFQTVCLRGEAGGSGMGLAIVKRCVEAMGGSVRLECPAARGAEFIFTWPVTFAGAGAAAAERAGGEML